MSEKKYGQISIDFDRETFEQNQTTSNPYLTQLFEAPPRFGLADTTQQNDVTN